MRALVACAVFLVLAPASYGEVRNWTSADGARFAGEYVSSDGKAVKIQRKTDGKLFEVPLARLSGPDQAFVAQQQQMAAAKAEQAAVNPAAKATGEIRDPKPGETVAVGDAVSVRGRTRDVPEGYVAMLFRTDPKDGYTFPHGDPIKPNRAFTSKIHHQGHELGEWGLDLVALPEEDAKKLSEWYHHVVGLIATGRHKEIQPYDEALIGKVRKLAGFDYLVEGK